MKLRCSSLDGGGSSVGRRFPKFAVGAVVAIAAAGVAVLRGGGAGARVSPASLAASATRPHASPVVALNRRSSGGRATFEAPSARPSGAPELAHFFAGLAGLERHVRRESVRILWFGDSHTAADYLTGAVRSALSRHYGSGGPGFVRLGVSPYRHELATPRRRGRFRLEPEPISRRSPQGDGVFGLGGIRASPFASPAEMSLDVGGHAVNGRARFSLLFELPEASAFHVGVGKQALWVTDAKQAERVPRSPILRLSLTADAQSVLKVAVRKGRPRFYGVIVEGSEPGIVLDTLGIDGARVATALAWREGPFIAEVTARQPDLVVLAYGTNEAFDALDVQAYDRQMSDLLGRLRRAAPTADCLILGPPDALSSNGESQPRVALISSVYERVANRVGCAFASGQTLMGGPGGFARWRRAEPPLARSDRIHLTPRGYCKLGELIAAAVFGEPLPVADGVDKNSP